MLESHMVRGQNWKLFLASCALAPGFDQRDFTARRLGDLLSGNREWALKTCLSWVGEYFRLTSLRACLLSCEEDPNEKLPCYDFIVHTRLTTQGQIVRKKVPQHLTFDLTLGLQAISWLCYFSTLIVFVRFWQKYFLEFTSKQCVQYRKWTVPKT